MSGDDCRAWLCLMAKHSRESQLLKEKKRRGGGKGDENSEKDKCGFEFKF